MLGRCTARLRRKRAYIELLSMRAGNRKELQREMKDSRRSGEGAPRDFAENVCKLGFSMAGENARNGMAYLPCSIREAGTWFTVIVIVTPKNAMFCPIFCPRSQVFQLGAPCCRSSACNPPRYSRENLRKIFWPSLSSSSAACLLIVAFASLPHLS